MISRKVLKDPVVKAKVEQWKEEKLHADKIRKRHGMTPYAESLYHGLAKTAMELAGLLTAKELELQMERERGSTNI